MENRSKQLLVVLVLEVDLLGLTEVALMDVVFKYYFSVLRTYFYTTDHFVEKLDIFDYSAV